MHSLFLLDVGLMGAMADVPVGKVFIDTHEGFKGLRVSMRDYANQSWLENIPLYAFPEYFTMRYRCPNIPITPYKDRHEL